MSRVPEKLSELEYTGVQDLRDSPRNRSSPVASLFVETHGRAGTPVVLLHGLAGSGRYWDKVLPYLLDDHRVIVPDLFGFGRSPKPKVAYTVEDHVAALRESIEAEVGAAPVFLVGHSMGSLLAVDYALANPGQVLAIALVCPPLFGSPEEARRRVASLSPMAAMVVRHPFWARAVCHLHETFESLGRRVARRMNPTLPAAVAEDAVAHTWRSFSGSLQQVVLESDLSDLVHRLHDVPILILFGEGDPLAETDALRNLAQRVGAEFRSLPGGHHLLLNDERPAMEAIDRFLKLEPSQDSTHS